MNHGFVQGNKRTAYAITEWFLWRNGLGMIMASDAELISFCYTAENDKWSVDQLDEWLRSHISPDPKP